MRSNAISLSRFSTLLAPEFSSNPTKLSLTPRRHKRQLTFRQPLYAHCTPVCPRPVCQFLLMSLAVSRRSVSTNPATLNLPVQPARSLSPLLISHLEHLHNHARFPMLIRVHAVALSDVANTRRPPSPSKPRHASHRHGLYQLYPVSFRVTTDRKSGG